MNTELRLLRDTGSPSGRFALAWGVPGVSDLESLSEKKFWDALDKARNYVVEKKTLRIVSTLPLHERWTRDVKTGQRWAYKSGGNDWSEVKGIGRNHSDVSTLWNPTEDTLVVIHFGKWWYNAIYFGERVGQGFRFIEIGDDIEDYVRDRCRSRQPKLYRQDHRADERDPYVYAFEPKNPVFRPGGLSLGVECDSMWRMKNNAIGMKSTGSLRIVGTVELRVRSTPARLSATPVRFRPDL